MTCGSCVQTVTEALKGVAGVSDVTVTLVPPKAIVHAEASVSDATLRDAVQNLGRYRIQAAIADAPAEHAAAAAPFSDPAELNPSFYPLLLIIGYICAAVALAIWSRGPWSWHAFMNDFMAGFFLVFSFFKLLDLRGFASMYPTYDVVARAWKPWGFIYPFVELALGVAYLVRWQPVATSIVTAIVMLIGSVGVLRALLDKRAIRCACLGTAIRLPMTTVTLIEDVGMAAMALAMLALERA